MRLEEDNKLVNLKEKTSQSINSMNRMIKFTLKLWWLFLIAGILSGVAGLLYASSQKIKYKSSLTFAMDDGDQNGIGSFLNIASQFGINVGSGKNIFAGDNIIDIMKSRRMIESVLLSVDTFNKKPSTLIEYFLDKTDRRRSNLKLNNIYFPAGQERSTFSYQQDSVLYTTYLDFANNYLEASRPDRKLSIYEVNFTSTDEKFTKDFTDRIVAETNNFYIQIKTKKAKETFDILESRAESMKGSLNSSITDKAAIQDVNLNPAFSAAQVPVLKQQTNIQVYGAAYGEMFKNVELARFQYLNEIPLMQLIDPANYPMKKIKVSKIKTGLTWAFASSILIFFIFWIKRIISFEPLPKKARGTSNEI